MLAGHSPGAPREGNEMRDNPLVKAILSLLHLVESAVTSEAAASNVRGHVDAPKGIPNDPGRRPPKR